MVFAPHDISVILNFFNESPSEVRCIGEFHLDSKVVDITNTFLTFPEQKRPIFLFLVASF